MPKKQVLILQNEKNKLKTRINKLVLKALQKQLLHNSRLGAAKSFKTEFGRGLDTGVPMGVRTGSADRTTPWDTLTSEG